MSTIALSHTRNCGTSAAFQSATRERELTKLRVEESRHNFVLRDMLNQPSTPTSQISRLYGQWFKARTQLDAALAKTGGGK